MSYSVIAIIYNPKSTGSSESLARSLHKDLSIKLPNQRIELLATKHAGHARELAYDISKKYDKPLIISSSGDGGYNEVINGALQAQSEGANPITSLLPAGNANDHHRNLHNSSLIEQIVAMKTRSIDVLTLRGHIDSKQVTRYAHSYMGFGLTPRVGQELNKSKLNRITETLLVTKSLFTLKPVSLEIDGSIRSYDSVIFSNVDSMSKYLHISSPSSIKDGECEVTIFPHRSKFQLFFLLMKSLIFSSDEMMRVSSFALRTTDKTLFQADGEILTLDAKSKVAISVEKQLLRTIV